MTAEEIAEKHSKQVDKLKKKEGRLQILIGETHNEELQNVYLEWMDLRNECNTTYVDLINSLGVK